MITLLIYDSAILQSVVGAAAVLTKFPVNADHTVKDLNGILTADISTYIGTLSDDTYDEIHICVESEVAAATAKLNKTQLALLLPKLKTASQGTQVHDQVDGDIFSVVTIGDALLTMTVDAEIGNYVNIYGGTGLGQLALVTDNTATTLTVGSNFDVTPDATSDHYLLSGVKMYQGGNVVGTKQPSLVAWENLYPVLTPPLMIFRIGEYKFAEVAATADSAATGSLTDSGAFAGLDLDDHYVYIYSATAGEHQYAKIASHTDDVLTLTANWPITPTGTIVYRVMPDTEELFYDIYTLNYIGTYLLDVTDGAVIDEWVNLIDEHQNNDEKTFGAPGQDFKAIENTVPDEGKGDRGI